MLDLNQALDSSTSEISTVGILNSRTAIEADAIIIPWKESIAPASDYATIDDVLEQNSHFDSINMLTDNDLDLYFDENTGDIENAEDIIFSLIWPRFVPL